MNLSNRNKKILNDEFKLVLEKMEESKSPDEMMYFFTAFYNMIHRIYNIEFSEELLFTHFVMENAYNTIMTRMGMIKAGQSSVIGFHGDFGSALIAITREIKENFWNKTKRNLALQKLVSISYTTTGNGFYLSRKGSLKLPIELNTQPEQVSDTKDKT